MSEPNVMPPTREECNKAGWYRPRGTNARDAVARLVAERAVAAIKEALYYAIHPEELTVGKYTELLDREAKWRAFAQGQFTKEPQ